MFLPKLSSYHTIENSQGTLDPLGLYPIADNLANLLAPSLRERMKHPRYLTAIAIGAIICSDFDEDELAADGLSAPWQVYEWYVASAFVKYFEKGSNELKGLPGSEKTGNAKKADVPLSAIRYLKTPSVFGFHGVYRTLAKGIDLISHNHIGEFGSQLIDVWEEEQGLPGFKVGLRGTKGYDFRVKLVDAVRQGLVHGSVAKTWYWEYYNTIALSLAPKSPGKRESELLYQKLSEHSNRKELIDFIVSRKGRSLLNASSEKQFHSELLHTAKETKEVLLAIQSYESVCRLLFNAFYEVLQFMTRNQNKGSVIDFSKLQNVKKAHKDLPNAFKKAEKYLEPFKDQAINFLINFEGVRSDGSITDWIKLLFEHHIKVQNNKTPRKASWLLEHTSGNYLLNNTQNLQHELNDEYVHQYRSYALYSFLKDMKKTD